MNENTEREREAVNSLRAFAAGIRQSRTLGETGLTNPSHSSSPGIWTAHSAPHTLKLLNLTRFQVICLHFTLSPNTSWLSDKDWLGSDWRFGPPDWFTLNWKLGPSYAAITPLNSKLTAFIPKRFTMSLSFTHAHTNGGRAAMQAGCLVIKRNSVSCSSILVERRSRLWIRQPHD